MRTAAAALLCLCALAASAAAGTTPVLAGRWTNAAMGTSGPARLLSGKQPELRLSAPALGCAEPTALAVRYRRGVLSGRGRDVACNEGLRWTVHGRLAQGRLRGRLTLRLADGSRATLALELR